MMTASVAMGVAVDDTIHFLTWFRGGVLQGKTRREAIMLAYDRCAGAMTQTTLIGGLGLSVFAFSTFTPTQRFGVMMLTLLGAALVGDLIFLPAILASPLGKCFCPKPAKKSKSEPATGQVQESVLESTTESGSTPHGGLRSKQGEPLHLRRDRGHRGPPN
jgi:multidrug efflux pump subunit AcrB